MSVLDLKDDVVLVRREDMQFCIDAIAHLHEQKARIRLEQMLSTAPSGKAPLEGVSEAWSAWWKDKEPSRYATKEGIAADAFRAGWAAALLPASAAPVAQSHVAKAVDRHLTANGLKSLVTASPPASGAVEAGWQPTHRHKKRGTEYVVVGTAQVQAPADYPLTDYELVTVYRGKDNELWVRRKPEFEDGRFEALPAAPTEGR